MEWWNQLVEVFQSLWTFVVTLLRFIAEVLPHVLGLGLWCVWWLAAVNWKKLWPALAQGAWAPAVLLLVMATLVWSRLVPGELGWQLTVVGSLACLALFCGWLQGSFGWTPPEIVLEPAAETGHDHFHAHEHGDAHEAHDEPHSDHGHH
jgi:hypothetical protein